MDLGQGELPESKLVVSGMLCLMQEVNVIGSRHTAAICSSQEWSGNFIRALCIEIRQTWWWSMLGCNDGVIQNLGCKWAAPAEERIESWWARHFEATQGYVSASDPVVAWMITEADTALQGQTQQLAVAVQEQHDELIQGCQETLPATIAAAVAASVRPKRRGFVRQRGMGKPQTFSGKEMDYQRGTLSSLDGRARCADVS